MEQRHVTHIFPPIVDNECKILILGSVPSVKSMQEMFYYGHKQNRFWKVLDVLFCCEVSKISKEGKTEFLLKHHIALYDSVFECDIFGSSDSKIQNVIHADIKSLVSGTKISHIFANGQKSFEELLKGNAWAKDIATKLPSTSPANASFSLEKLCESWKIILDMLK